MGEGEGCQKWKVTEWDPLKVKISQVYCFVTDFTYTPFLRLWKP